MERTKIQTLVSLLTDSTIHFGAPIKGKLSFLSRFRNTYPFFYAAEEDEGDEDMDMGYESSWSGIFQNTRGGIDKEGH